MATKKVDKNWIQKAVNPKHKGFCTPETKKTCTPKRKALAHTLRALAKKSSMKTNGVKYGLKSSKPYEITRRAKRKSKKK